MGYSRTAESLIPTSIIARLAVILAMIVGGALTYKVVYFYNGPIKPGFKIFFVFIQDLFQEARCGFIIVPVQTPECSQIKNESVVFSF